MHAFWIGLALCSLALTLLAHACAWGMLRRRPRRSRACPPVTILKPLKGIDDDLRANLETFLRLDYPCYQVVFGVEDPADPAAEVARSFQREHPDRDIAVVAGARVLGRNPKVNNLASMARVAKHGLWLISDSNVRVRPSYLAETMSAFDDPDVGMVTNLIAGVGERSLGALLENQQLNSFVVGCMSGAELLTPMACVVGKSMAFRRTHLEELGGWPSLADILAEDYVLAQRFHAAGHGVVTSSHVIETVNASWSVRRFLNRHLRWGQIRRRNSTGIFLSEPLLYPLPFAILLALLGAPGIAAGILAARLVADELLARLLRGRGYPLRHWPALLLRDLLVAGIWAVAAFRRRVWWRGNLLWIDRGSRLVEPHGRETPEPAPLAPEPSL